MFLTLMRAGQQYYNSLSPEQKAKVDSIIRWGVVRAVKFTVGDILGDVAHQVIAEGYGEKVAEFAQAVVVRGVEVGIDKALEEAHGGSSPSDSRQPPAAGRDGHQANGTSWTAGATGAVYHFDDGGTFWISNADGTRGTRGRWEQEGNSIKIVDDEQTRYFFEGVMPDSGVEMVLHVKRSGDGATVGKAVLRLMTSRG
jgi:hypothetical protein